METTHGPNLSRMSTAPVSLQSSYRPSRDPYPSKMNGHGPRSSKMSQSTLTSASSASLNTLSQVSTATSQGSGTVIATSNIINQRADASRSLYQICLSLRQRLLNVTGFEEHLRSADSEGDEQDVVASLWRCLQKGYPLITIYNILQPGNPYRLDDEKISEAKRPKNAASKFVVKCLTDLKLPAEEVFVVSDLFGTDTTGFLKVTQVINTVLNLAVQRGLIQEDIQEDAGPTSGSGPGGKMSYRDHVVRELVDTERKYVQDLENLHELKLQIEQKGVVPGDIVHAIFLNINAILDHQRRFLIRMETTNSQPEQRQDWGGPFTAFEDGFQTYYPFIANQQKAATIAKREFEKLHLANHPVVEDFNTLDGFLLKPMQRLVKYPMLLKDLRDKTDADMQTKALLQAGMDAAERVLIQANAAVDREMRAEALEDLCNRVDDWKNHDVHQFGELLLHGVFNVITGKSDLEKEVKTYTISHPDMPVMPSAPSAPSNTPSQKNQYTLFLFERILLCCKEISPNKAAKDKLLGSKDRKAAKEKLSKEKKSGISAAPKLQLKGRIFMTNVTDVVSMAKPGSYTVQIWWKGDQSIENFVIRYSNEDLMRKWSAAVDKQRKESLEEREISRAPSISAAPEFAWMQGQQMHNPYAEPDDDNDDDDEYPNLANSGPFSQQAHASQDYGGQHTFPGQGNFSMNRNASSTSLRSRSTTGESSQSLAGMARQPPPRFPMPPQQPLSLQTHVGQTAPSPGPHGGPGYQPDSYFSPVGESPASIASSRASQNSMYPFPRQGTPQGYDDQNRHTAPAMRAPSRGSQQSIIAAPPNGRNPQRPSLPPMSSQGNIRSRSYSTPDINAQLSQQRRKNELAGVPAVPGIPPHLHPAYDHGIPRSSNGSPINGALPVRAATQSPGVQRERMPSTSQPSGYQANVPPPYLRSNTAQIPHNRMDNRSEDYTMAPSAHGHQASTSSASANLNDLSLPTQLKVKVNCDGNYVTLVVAFNITYQSLIDRIDAKIGRFSNSAIAKGTMRLRYRDEDGDFVTIEGDEDIQVAFLEWREMEAAQGIAAGLGEIELFCAGVEMEEGMI